MDRASRAHEVCEHRIPLSAPAVRLPKSFELELVATSVRA